MATAVPPEGESQFGSRKGSEDLARTSAGRSRLPILGGQAFKEEVNGRVLLGSGLIFLGGLLYAVQEVAYDELVGATVPYTDNWVFDVLALAYFVFGLGLLLALSGLASGLPTTG